MRRLFNDCKRSQNSEKKLTDQLPTFSKIQFISENYSFLHTEVPWFSLITVFLKIELLVIEIQYIFDSLRLLIRLN